MSLVTYANCNIISGVESLKGDQSHLIYLLHFTVGSLDSLKSSVYTLCVSTSGCCPGFFFLYCFFTCTVFLVFSLPELKGGKITFYCKQKCWTKKKIRRNLLGIKFVAQTVIFSTEVLTYLNCCLLNHIA